MATTTQAVVVRAPGDRPHVEDVRLRDLAADQVRVRMVATGLCHSDLSLARGTLPHHTPVVLGHEGAGRVVEAGEDVAELGVGDPVVLNWTPPCGHCWFCGNGEPYLCQHALDSAARPYGRLADGTDVYPGLNTAALGTETVVAERACVKAPEGVPLEEASLIGCALLTGMGAVFNSARIRPGQSVAVIGLGGIGLCAVQAARIAGADPIVAVDPQPHRTALAQRLGATHVSDPGSDTKARVRELTFGRGIDHAIECVGRAETIRSAWSLTRRGGRATVVGLGSTTEEVTFNAQEVGYSARTLAGCMYGSSDPGTDIPAIAEHIRSGRVDLAGMISERISLEDVGTAMERLEAAAGARVLVTFP